MNNKYMTWILLSDRDYQGSHIISTHEKTVCAVTVNDEILDLRLKEEVTEDYLEAGMIDAKERLKEESK